MAFDHLTDEALLDALDAERGKATQADVRVMRDMINALIVRGIYPKDPVKENPSTVESMVIGYGARWFQWRGPFACPHCKTDLRDHAHGPPFKREIGIHDPELDRTTGFVCPDCSKPL